MPRLGVLALVGTLVLLLSGGARADTSVTIYSDPDDFLGQGHPWFFGPGSIRWTGSDPSSPADDVGLAVDDPQQTAWSFRFAAPPGRELVPGNYPEARRASLPGDHVGMEIGAGSRGCNEVFGRFELRDLVRRDDGTVRRAWILFQHHCEARVPATWGEIRLNLPAAATRPTVVRWSELDRWRTPTAVPVRYEGAAPLAGVAIGGAHPHDFAADDGGCRSTPCDVTVSFHPAAAGARTATLRLADAAGAVHEVALEGFFHGGTTRLETEELAIDPNYPREPRTYVFEPPAGKFVAQLLGDPVHGYLRMYGIGPDGDWYEGRFAPPAEGWEVGRTYTGVHNSWGGSTGASFQILGTHIPCARSESGGSFTLHEMTLDGGDDVRTLDVTWEQPCDVDGEKRPGLRGRWQYRAGDRSPLADWLVPGPRPGLGPLPPEPATPPAEPPAPAGGPSSPPPPAAAPLTAAQLRRAATGCARRSLRRLTGTPARDTLRGGRRADRLLGRGGPDRLLGRGGGDCLHGGGGDDRLHGGAGRDALFGGHGDDLLAGGPQADVIDCGPGRRDRAVAGPGDRVRGCERVRRARR